MIYLFIKCIKLLLLLYSSILYIFYNHNDTFVKSKNIYKNYKNNGNFNLFNKALYKVNNCLKQEVNSIYYFKLENIYYYYSFKHKKVKFEYNISLYDENLTLISPPDISLYYNISLICNIEIIYNNISIDSLYSLSSIKDNKYFNCIEFFNFNESIKIGIKFYNIYNNFSYNYISLFDDNFFNFNNIKFNFDELFDYLIINNDYNSLLENIYNNKQLNDRDKLKKSYIQYPLYSLKRKYHLTENYWKFENILNEYFCFCKGSKCLDYSNIEQYCKFSLYLNIIDNSRDLYPKTDYLFVDFIFSHLSSDDVYPIFEEMEKRNYPVHYITEKFNIYKKFCINNTECLTIIPINKNNYYNCGDFLQKYLTLILKLKSFISGKYSCYKNISYLFYNIEYITYISVGHGVCYFKYYLYKNDRLYGAQRNNKILIPPSEKIIFFAKQYGWKDENIIKLNLPRWEKYNKEILLNDKNTNNFTNRSILFMFTWRDMKKNKKISGDYINNSILLLSDLKLKEIIKQYNIVLYFTFHRFILNKYKKKYKAIISNNAYINYIDQNEISDCLSKTNLVVSDFSSIIFDFMYRRKPFIIYIPDANEPQIKNIYKEDYYNLIESLKNGTFYFENKFFDINSVVEKIIYYIKNDFNIEEKLLEFYDSFELKQEESINNFINYLHNLQ